MGNLCVHGAPAALGTANFSTPLAFACPCRRRQWPLHLWPSQLLQQQVQQQQQVQTRPELPPVGSLWWQSQTKVRGGSMFGQDGLLCECQVACAYVCTSPDNHRVQLFDEAGHFLRTIGSGIAGTSNLHFNYPCVEPCMCVCLCTCTCMCMCMCMCMCVSVCVCVILTLPLCASAPSNTG
jgi:hypothetical protein